MPQRLRKVLAVGIALILLAATVNRPVTVYSAENAVAYTTEEQIFLAMARAYYNDAIATFNAGYDENESLYDIEPVYNRLPLTAGVINRTVLAGSEKFLNAIRAGAGLKPVAASADIAQAAQNKAVLVRYLLEIEDKSAGHYPAKPAGVADSFYNLAQSYMGGEVLYMTLSGHPLTVITNALHDGFGDAITAGHRYSLLSPYNDAFGIGVAGQQGVVKLTTHYADSNIEVVAWPSKGVVLKETYAQGCYWTVNFYKNYQVTAQTTVRVVCLNTGETWRFDPEDDAYYINGNHMVSFRDASLESSLVVGRVYEITLDNLSGKDTTYTYRTVYESLDGKVTYDVKFWTSDSSYYMRTVESGTAVENIPGDTFYMDVDGSRFHANFTPMPPYYYVGGWFTGENGTGEAFTEDTIVTNNMDLYPKWVLKETTDAPKPTVMPTATATPTPKPPSDNGNVVDTFSAGDYYAMAIKPDNSLWGWGIADQIIGSTKNHEVEPRKIMDDVAMVSAGNQHTMVVKTDGSLWTWGVNTYGQLGDGTQTDRDTPVKIMDDVAMISAGDFSSIAVKKDGSLWEWGGSRAANKNKPTNVLEDVVAISAGAFHYMAVQADGSLWVCGQDGSGNTKSSPVKVMEHVKAVAAGTWYSMAVKTDGSLWAWGNNDEGTLGDGTAVNKQEPVKIMEHVAMVSAKSRHTMAIKTDGSLWAWGWNAYGQLGDGTTDIKYEPVWIMDHVKAISVGGRHSMALKTDGSLWVWGLGTAGQIGDGSGSSSHLPVKVIDKILN